MTLQVREFLNWYGANNTATPTNLARLLKHGQLVGTGRRVISPAASAETR